MSTTALLVEIIVIGAFGLVWVALFVFKALDLDVSMVSTWLTDYKDWSNGIVLLSIALSYQLGWSVNQSSYFLARKTFNKTIKRGIFKEEYKNYDSIRTTVYMHGSSFVVEKVKERLSVVRLTRSAFINFLLISIGLFIWEQWSAGLLTLIITVLFFLQASDMYSLYCYQILNSYNVIRSNPEEGSGFKGKGENLKLIPRNRRMGGAVGSGDLPG